MIWGPRHNVWTVLTSHRQINTSVTVIPEVCDLELREFSIPFDGLALRDIIDGDGRASSLKATGGGKGSNFFSTFVKRCRFLLLSRALRHAP